VLSGLQQRGLRRNGGDENLRASPDFPFNPPAGKPGGHLLSAQSFNDCSGEVKRENVFSTRHGSCRGGGVPASLSLYDTCFQPSRARFDPDSMSLFF